MILWNCHHHHHHHHHHHPVELPSLTTQVFEGSAVGLLGSNSRIQTVAIKFLSEDHADEQYDFIREAVRTLEVQHPRIVRLLGVCFASQPSFIVLEHMANGDLKGFLERHKEVYIGNRRRIDAAVMLRMCREIANALTFLASVKYVHRDLAARNVLVDVDEGLKSCSRYDSDARDEAG